MGKLYHLVRDPNIALDQLNKINSIRPSEDCRYHLNYTVEVLEGLLDNPLLSLLPLFDPGFVLRWIPKRYYENKNPRKNKDLVSALQKMLKKEKWEEQVRLTSDGGYSKAPHQLLKQVESLYWQPTSHKSGCHTNKEIQRFLYKKIRQVNRRNIRQELIDLERE